MGLPRLRQPCGAEEGAGVFGTMIVVSVGLALGYCLVVVSSLMATMAIASAARGFVVKNHCIRPAYKVAMDLFWTAVVVAAGFTAATVAGPGVVGWLTGAVLAGLLILVLWTNTWEARQRGLPHQILLTLLTCVGVLAGVYLRLR